LSRRPADNEYTPLDSWTDWIHTFRERFIAKQGWTAKEAKRRIRDGWAYLQNGKVIFAEPGVNRPKDARPAFQFLTHLGWKLPIQITVRLPGFVRKVDSAKSAKERFLDKLASVIEPEDVAEDAAGDVHMQCEHAAQAVWMLLTQLEDAELASATNHSSLWDALLLAIQVGRRHLLLELYKDPELLTSVIKAQAFSAGKKGDALTHRLEVWWLELRKKGCNPKPAQVAKAAGGVFS
jgi:hypothetical protein